MPLYKRPQDTAEDEEDQINQELENVNPDPTIVDDSGNWKKRYSDLRSHSQRQLNEMSKKVRDLETQVNAKFAPNLPKTKEEVEEWAKKYPDVYGLVKTIVGFDLRETTEEINARLAEVDKGRHENDKDKALNAIVAAHPDFYELESDQEFHAWLGSKSKRLQDAIYENDTDSQAAIEVLDMYKLFKGTEKRKPGRPSNRDAARNVEVPNSRTPPAGSRGDYDFSESQIESMSPRDYEKNEEAIEEARSKGRILYDMNGAAR